MDILLINPGKFRGQMPNEHLGILGLKSYVCSKGLTADVIDMAIENLSVTKAIPKILSQYPKTIGISMLDDTKTLGFEIVQQMELDFGGSKAISNVLNLHGSPFTFLLTRESIGTISLPNG